VNNIEARFKDAYDTNTLTGELEHEFSKHLKKQFGDDGFSWVQHICDIIGDEADDYANELVNNYLSY
jgi:hypothetical protein